MNINLYTLSRAMKTLPTPQHTGEHYALRIIDRVEELNTENGIPRTIPSPAIKPSDCNLRYREVHLISVPYCIDGRCWHEWELVA